MTHLVLPQMVERGKGAIVNMSAGGCTRPTPQMAVYAATKVSDNTKNKQFSSLIADNLHSRFFISSTMTMILYCE